MQNLRQLNQVNQAYRLLVNWWHDNSFKISLCFVLAGIVIDWGKAPFSMYVYPINDGLYWELWLTLNSLFAFLVFSATLHLIDKEYKFAKLIVRGAVGLCFADFIDHIIGQRSTFHWVDCVALFFIFIDIVGFILNRQRK